MSTEGFTLLWSKILDSSVWLQDKDTRLVWITMLAMRDSEGRVKAAPGALANRARVEKEACLKALEIFLSPDPESGNPANEGRRISVLPEGGGWQILNHEEYRFSTEAKREFWREQKRQQRESAARLAPSVSTGLQEELQQVSKGRRGGRRPGAGRPRVGDLSVPTASERLQEKLERDGDEAGALRVQELADGVAPGLYGSHGPEAQAVVAAKVKRTAVGSSTESSGKLGVSEASAAEIQHASEPVLEGPASVSTPPPEDDMPDPDAVPVPEV